MQQSFEYIKVQTAMDSITVENIGNVILEANNDSEYYWYLYINTDAGFTTIKEFGPIYGGSSSSKPNFNYNIQRMEYNEKGISKRINNFLNDPKREITQVMEMDEFDFSEKLEKVHEII